MFVVVGLGNFGKAYQNTYHNLGFMVVDRLAQKLGVSFEQEKFKSMVAQARFEGQAVLLAKPLTFMNNSGQALALIKKKYADAKILVVVDDVDLPCGKVRYRERGSSGTHNGLRSIVSFIGEDFQRVKIGIASENIGDLADYVLSPIKDEKLFDGACEEAANLVLQKIAENNS